MNQKNILITGVSTGIGRGLALHYCKMGHRVIGTVRKAMSNDALLMESNFTQIVYDVNDKSNLMQFQLNLEHQLEGGTLFALINNAGIALAGPLEYIDEDDFMQLLDTNVLAVRRITNVALRFMSEGSRIINMSSVSGLFNSPFSGPYCISKHALESMTDVYRRELAAFDIKVVAIEPGPIKTPIWSKAKGTLDKYQLTRYGGMLSKADRMIENAEKHAMDISEIAKVCDEALFKQNPKTRYIVHKSKRLFKFFAKMVPDKIADYLVARSLKKGDKHRVV